MRFIHAIRVKELNLFRRPETRCFGSNVEYDAFFANTVIEQGITVSSIANLSDPHIYEELIPQYQQFLALKKGQAELCRQNMGEELSFMSTTTVVRDMDYISKVLETADTKMYVYAFKTTIVYLI